MNERQGPGMNVIGLCAIHYCPLKQLPYGFNYLCGFQNTDNTWYIMIFKKKEFTHCISYLLIFSYCYTEIVIFSCDNMPFVRQYANVSLVI